MTTRKALIERIQAMQLGTQEMLDAAEWDARKIPFDTLFLAKAHDGALWRDPDPYDDQQCVKMTGSEMFYSASELLPINEE